MLLSGCSEQLLPLLLLLSLLLVPTWALYLQTLLLAMLVSVMMKEEKMSLMIIIAIEDEVWMHGLEV